MLGRTKVYARHYIVALIQALSYVTFIFVYYFEYGIEIYGQYPESFQEFASIFTQIVVTMICGFFMFYGYYLFI